MARIRRWALPALCLLPVLWAAQDVVFQLAYLDLGLHEDVYYGYLLFFHLRNWLSGRFGMWIGNGDVVMMQHASVALVLAALGGAWIAISTWWCSSQRLQQVAIVSGLVLPWLSYVYLSPFRGPGSAGAYVLLLAYCASLAVATSQVSAHARWLLLTVAGACAMYCGFAFTDWWLLWSTGALWSSLLLFLAVMPRYALREAA